MPIVVLIDTSVFMNVLDVPSFNQHRDHVLGKFQEFIEERAHLLLPIATVFESGNHIAQLSDGGNRRAYAKIFATRVKEALAGDAPWRPIQPPSIEVLDQWMDEFEEHAMRHIGLGDLSIIKEWQAACNRHPHLRVMIWALDADLAGYDRCP